MATTSTNQSAQGRNVPLNPELHERMKNLAQRRGTKLYAEVARAIRQYLKREEGKVL